MVCPGYTEKSGAQVCCCFLREAYGRLLSMTALFNMISSQSEVKSSVIHPRGDCQTVKKTMPLLLYGTLLCCRTSGHSV